MTKDTSIVNVQVAADDVDTPEKLAARYMGKPMTPETLAALRADARRLGTGHVFVAKNLRYIHIGEMSAPVFAKLVGRKPEIDDMYRVNCLRVGEAGHHMCGWCDDCGGPRFQCGCMP